MSTPIRKKGIGTFKFPGRDIFVDEIVFYNLSLRKEKVGGLLFRYRPFIF